MAEQAPLPSFAAVVVAAGKGLRVGGATPKQYRQWRGRPLVRHSVEALLRAGADPLIVVIAEGAEQQAKRALEGCGPYRIATGGSTRQASVFAGLTSLEKDKPERVLIHDAARPDLPRPVIERLLSALDRHAGAIPVLPVVDSLAHVGENGTMSDPEDRAGLRRVQTPQAFRFDAILSAHREWNVAPDAGDDAQVLRHAGGTVQLVEGDERLRKVTFASDLEEVPTPPVVRVGQGFDVHRLVRGEELWLCGVRLDHDRGLSGHSDADVALHAITDAVLGAIGAGDIGTHFPPSDPQWAGVRSGRFLEHAIGLCRKADYVVANIDLTIICEAPKIGPHRPAMRTEVARLAGIEESAVSIKATTTEGLGFTGRGEGIAAQAVVTVSRGS